jgi:hypothetical protein
MDDAISRSAVLKFLGNLRTLKQNNQQLYSANLIDGIMKRVEKLTALDVEPVVRCRDCKYRCTMVCPMYHTETCLYDLDGFDDYNVDRTDNDGFCHLGERWEGEEDE